MNDKIEFEQVTIKLPKLIMEYLQKTEEDPIGWIESNIVHEVRAELEAMDSAY